MTRDVRIDKVRLTGLATVLGYYLSGEAMKKVPVLLVTCLQMAVDPERTKRLFIMKPEGVALIFGSGRTDGPFPEHYEPWESPVSNLIVWHPE